VGVLAEVAGCVLVADAAHLTAGVPGRKSRFLGAERRDREQRQDEEAT
jgi:hypothetical protein